MFKIRPKTLVLGGLALAAAAGALKNRDKVAGLIGARSSAPEPPRPEPAPAPRSGGDPAAPAPSNYDLGGPAANTATKVPAPEAAVLDDDGGIDERAEEEAAAAEAAAIGGGVPEYPGLEADVAADETVRPLMEAGEGESEGQELAEFDLRDEAEPRSGEASDAERQIDETIEAQDNPAAGETIETGETSGVRQRPDFEKAGGESPAPNGSGGESQSAFGFAGGKVGGEEDPAPGLPNTEAVEAVEGAAEDDGPEIHPDQTSLLEGEDPPKEKPAAEKSSAVWQPPESPGKGDDEGGSQWQTWSGRAEK